MPAKPHRRLPKRRAYPVIHANGVKPQLLAHRVTKTRPPGAVTASELERDMLCFLAERYGDRHLDIEVAQLALSNTAQRLIVAHLKAVA